MSMSENPKIQAAAIVFVKKVEKDDNRTAHDHFTDGYDLRSCDSSGQDARHIEVKSTDKAFLDWRWLEEDQHTALQNDSLFWHEA